MKDLLNFTESFRYKIIKNSIIGLCLLCCGGILYRTGFSSNSLKVLRLNSPPIYDRNDIILAYSRLEYDIYVDISKITNSHETYESVRQLIDITYDKFALAIRQYRKKDDDKNLCFIGTTLNNIVGAPKRPEIVVIKRMKRVYPLGKYITTIGISDHSQGLYTGLEYLTNQGTEIHSTIDSKLQYIIAKEVEKGKADYKAKGAFAVLLSPEGEILAMHTTDCCDPERPKSFVNNVLYSNYEFGSTCKTFTTFIGLHTKAFDRKTVFNLPGPSIQVGYGTVYDVEKIEQVTNIDSIMAHSSNVGIVLANRKIGSQYLKLLFKFFKLDEQVEMSNTVTVKPIIAKNMNQGDIERTSFGYGIAPTAINMVRAYLSIFNHGLIINPRIIKGEKKIIGKIESDAFDECINVLKYVASRHDILKMYNCASKTGTAYLFENGKYQTEKERVNTFIVCGIPDAKKEKYFVLLVGMLDPGVGKLSGLNTRQVCANIVNMTADYLKFIFK